MCGICGIADFEHPERGGTAVRQMMAAMRHRGPDDEGLLLAPPAALGMRRLSIIDLPGGHQPVFNEDETLAVVFNGEIYNFRELRRSLEAEGHVFRSRSDTETIVHAYKSWGADCVQHLRGMFAFAVLEMAGRSGVGSRLFLARDRLGIKPLYYATASGAFLFASEVRALLASGRVEPRLSTTALESYLLFGSVGEPMALLEGFRSLPPGHRMTISLTGNAYEFRPEPYWDLPHQDAVPTEPKADAAPAALQVRRLLEESVRGHLIADVPLGIFLSSGLDSTALAALASRERSGVLTLTVAFPEQDFSEAALARRTAARLGTQHQEILLSGEEMLARQEEAVAALDQPSMDGVNTYFVSWAARQAGLKVVLSGLGGDEVFGGYSTFRSTPRVRSLAALAAHSPDSARRLAAAALVKLGEAAGFADQGRKLAAAWRAPGALPHPYFFTRLLFVPEQAARLLRDRAANEDSPWRAWLAEAAREAEGADNFAAVSRLELRSYLVNTLLRDTDAMSMAHSLEVRVPLLDHPLVEFVTPLPARLKRRRGVNKALLVDALRDVLPEEVVRQRKRTFTLPWERWLRGALREPVGEGLASLSPALGAVLDANVVRGVWRDFLAGRTSWSRPWSLYVLNQWVARHIDGAAPMPANAVTAAVAASRGAS
jgi:asparagine synthase (glutamine-hydrolysing)